MFVNLQKSIYHNIIAGNFRGRILSRIGRKTAFHGENFCGMLIQPYRWDIYGMPKISWRTLSHVALKVNRKIHESFFPSKRFPLYGKLLHQLARSRLFSYVHLTITSDTVINIVEL